MQRTILMKDDQHLLRLNPLETASHLLRKSDVSRVAALVSFLDSVGLDVYLGGSVVKNAIFGSIKPYGDIDLLAVHPTNDDNSIRYANLLHSHDRSGDAWILQDHRFYVDHIAGELLDESLRYLCGAVDERFNLHPPCRRSLERFFGKSSPSVIDLNFVAAHKLYSSISGVKNIDPPIDPKALTTI